MKYNRFLKDEFEKSAREYPVVTLLGPRQSGKTTLCRELFPHYRYESLENPDTRLYAETDPRGFLKGHEKGLILDEVQRLPSLLSYLQGMVDKEPIPGRVILTGSHQPGLHEGVAQTLAGRTALLTLLPLSLEEIAKGESTFEDPYSLIQRGFFPGVWNRNLNPTRFFRNYLQTYVEKDLRSMIQVQNLRIFQQFLLLLAGRIGQVLNLSSLSGDLGVSSTTLKNWLSVLKGGFILFELSPYFLKIPKRVVKSSKFYFTDPGLACFILGLQTPQQVARDPLRGALYENFLVIEALKSLLNRGENPDLFFIRDSNSNELDLLFHSARGLYPMEIKSSKTFHSDFLKGFYHFRELRDARHCVSTGGTLFFDGEGGREIHGIRLENILSAPQIFRELLT